MQNPIKRVTVPITHTGLNPRLAACAITVMLMLVNAVAPAYAAISTSSNEASAFRGQLDRSTELLTIEGGTTSFLALQNRTLSADLLGGAVLLTNANSDWIDRTRELRTGLAIQGWDLMMAEPSFDNAENRLRAQLLIDRLREQGNGRILLIATGLQAANAITLASTAPDIRLVLFNASSETLALSDLEAQMQTLGAAPTIELYTRDTQLSEAAQRHKIAQQMEIETYSARQLFGPLMSTSTLNRATSKQILGAIKTLIIESEQNAG